MPVPFTAANFNCQRWSTGPDFNRLIAILQTADSSFVFRYMVRVEGVEPPGHSF